MGTLYLRAELPYPSMDRQRYCSQLRALADCSRSREVVVPECLRVMSTPLKPVSWRSELLNHPDQEFVKTLLQGIAEGFRIGYDASKAHLRQKAANMLSASEHREVVSLYLMEELKANWLVHCMCGFGGSGTQHGSPLQPIWCDTKEKQAEQVAPNNQPLCTRRL